jgi:hypothetical protein
MSISISGRVAELMEFKEGCKYLSSFYCGELAFHLKEDTYNHRGDDDQGNCDEKNLLNPNISSLSLG